jgi:protein involved in polysaccharide export with SLBB domain
MTLGLIDDYSLKINHKQNTFNMPVFGKYSVKSFVDLLGLDMANVDEEATYISPIENIVIKDNFKKMHFSAAKYNTVSFRSPINDLINITIEGAVDYPGQYTLQSDSSVQDLYQMVGSFKDEAFKKGIIFTRESIRERQLKSIEKSKEALNKALAINQQEGKDMGDLNIIRALAESIEPENLGRIAGDFSPESVSSMETILRNGDKIFIPVNSNAINVLGEVVNPIAFEYSKALNVRSAIEMAGGYQDYADKRKVYVIKASGMIERANRNIFVKNVSLEPGDTIIVPRKIITNNPGIDALIPITSILSDLAFSAAALETLSNNN